MKLKFPIFDRDPSFGGVIVMVFLIGIPLTVAFLIGLIFTVVHLSAYLGLFTSLCLMFSVGVILAVSLGYIYLEK